MGYEHYYRVVPEFDLEKFALVARDFGRLLAPIKKAGANLGSGHAAGRPTVNRNKIQFNGLEREDGHCEEFTLERQLLAKRVYSKKANGKFNQAVKTRRKPYDLAVMACLVVAKRHLGSGIIVNSDGSLEDWRKAIELCEEVLGYGADFAFEDEEGWLEHV